MRKVFVIIVTTVLLVFLSSIFGCKKAEEARPKESYHLNKEVPAEPEKPTAMIRSHAELDKNRVDEEYTVWYGTNRIPIDRNDKSKGFTAERDGETHYGTVKVWIPKSHKIGSVGSSWWKRLFRGDDRLKIVRIDSINSELEFLKSVSNALKELNENDKVVLVYIHGFSVPFEEAAIRAAQIGFDLKVPGITAFFSWPSRGEKSLIGYNSDGDSVQVSEQALASFLNTVVHNSGAKRVHVVAHSMGNRALLRVINNAVKTASANKDQIKFGQIFLAAPDIDVDLFRQLAGAYAKVAERTTLYVSPKDKAVEVSSFLGGNPRVGFTPPVTVVKGIDTIEVKNIDLDMLGHSYYAEAFEVLNDISELIYHNEPPERRIRLRAVSSPHGSYWTFNE